MLAIARKKGESVRIGDDILITVASIHPGKVKIGIEAPQEVTIMRDELVMYARSKSDATARLREKTRKRALAAVKLYREQAENPDEDIRHLFAEALTDEEALS